MKKHVLVTYLFTCFDKKSEFNNFVNHYKRYRAGVSHKLLICFKMMNGKQISLIKLKLKKVQYIEYVDPWPLNDYDFGTYGRVAKKFNNYLIFFMNSHSYPIKDQWLKKILNHYKKNTIIGTTGSYESLITSLKLKKVYKLLNFCLDFFKLYKLFNFYPNPHIRTANFLISAKDYILFNKKKIYNKKIHAWNSESGKNGLTNFFKTKGYNIFVINSDGAIFNVNQWKESKTYCFKNQQKLLISDLHTRKYQQLSKNNKKLFEKKVWNA
jgi:hypothetical protein